jgi:hypothetical protein
MNCNYDKHSTIEGVTILNTSIYLDSEALCSRIYRNKARIFLISRNKARIAEIMAKNLNKNK